MSFSEEIKTLEKKAAGYDDLKASYEDAMINVNNAVTIFKNNINNAIMNFEKTIKGVPQINKATITFDNPNRTNHISTFRRNSSQDKIMAMVIAIKASGDEGITADGISQNAGINLATTKSYLGKLVAMKIGVIAIKTNRNYLYKFETVKIVVNTVPDFLKDFILIDKVKPKEERGTGVVTEFSGVKGEDDV